MKKRKHTMPRRKFFNIVLAVIICLVLVTSFFVFSPTRNKEGNDSKMTSKRGKPIETIIRKKPSTIDITKTLISDDITSYFKNDELEIEEIGDQVVKTLKRLKSTNTKNDFNAPFSHRHFVKDAENLFLRLSYWLESQRILYTGEYKKDEYIDKYLEKGRTYKNEDISKRCRKFYENGLSTHFQGQYGEDMVMLNYFFHGREKGFYVEVGSYFPHTYSNSYFFDVCLGWKGVCVEGNPDNLAKWPKDRTCKVIRKCASDKKETVGISSDGPMTIFGEEGDVGERKVQCDTLEALLTEAGLDRSSKIDFLSVDIEGFEEKVLTSFDIENWNIEVLMIEFLFISPDLAYFLEDRGYYKIYTPTLNYMFAKSIIPPPFRKGDTIWSNRPYFNEWDLNKKKNK